jgi:hypothetical protein
MVAMRSHEARCTVGKVGFAGRLARLSPFLTSGDLGFIVLFEIRGEIDCCWQTDRPIVKDI